eukprot:GHVT01101662.1.p1 GENE.GHVT01101662.1~~GHVT01101662.1.p1  ORF type:complete len:268 (+),score=23.35 GHVT01101662.1:972-1775(+)
MGWLSYAQKKRIMQLARAGKKRRQIALLIPCSLSSVSLVLSRGEEGLHTWHRRRMTETQREQFAANLRMHPDWPSARLASGIEGPNLHVTTWRSLANELAPGRNIRGRKPRRPTPEKLFTTNRRTRAPWRMTEAQREQFAAKLRMHPDWSVARLASGIGGKHFHASTWRRLANKLAPGRTLKWRQEKHLAPRRMTEAQREQFATNLRMHPNWSVARLASGIGGPQLHVNTLHKLANKLAPGRNLELNRKPRRLTPEKLLVADQIDTR